MKTVSNITFDALTLLSKNSFVAVESAWERKRLGFWDCHGEIVGNEPIVAVSIMRIGNRVEWARSGKGSTTKLDVRLLLGMYDSNPKDVQVTFFIGGTDLDGEHCLMTQSNRQKFSYIRKSPSELLLLFANHSAIRQSSFSDSFFCASKLSVRGTGFGTSKKFIEIRYRTVGCKS
jgi:hypothetical protein